jgi:hypothetical protein
MAVMSRYLCDALIIQKDSLDVVKLPDLFHQRSRVALEKAEVA